MNVTNQREKSFFMICNFCQKMILDACRTVFGRNFLGHGIVHLKITHANIRVKGAPVISSLFTHEAFAAMLS